MELVHFNHHCCRYLLQNRFLPIIFLFFHSQNLISQEIVNDSDGDNIFLYYKAMSRDFSFSSADEALKVNWGFQPFKRNLYYYLEGIDTVRTVFKSSSLFIKAKLSNQDGDIFINELNDVNPKWEFNLGYQKSLDSVYFDNLKNTTRWSWAWGINTFWIRENLSLYDTMAMAAEKKYPLSYGIKANLTVVHYSRLCFALTGKLANNSNSESLAQYQKNEPLYIDNQVIALEDIEGRIGKLETSWNYRFSVGVPYVPFYDSRNKQSVLSRFVTTPFAVFSGGSANTYRVGVAISFLENTENFSLSEGFGLGIDWLKEEEGWSSPFVYVSGNISISGKPSGKIEKVKFGE